MPLSADDYIRQRDALVDKLNMVTTSIGELKDKDKDLDTAELAQKEVELRSIMRRVYEDQFKLVLIAQSQGGKSTTFNAVGGGSVISPMGNAALKCSAAPIIQVNVIEPSEIGAYVELRTDNELGEICIELLGAALPEGKFNINDPAQVAKARAQHERLVRMWRSKQAETTDEQRDLLLSGLILAFFDSPEIRRLKTTAGSRPNRVLRISLAEAAQMARFPEDFVRRYSSGNPHEFRADEVYFPFIRRIVCRLSSESLARLVRASQTPRGLSPTTQTQE